MKKLLLFSLIIAGIAIGVFNQFAPKTQETPQGGAFGDTIGALTQWKASTTPTVIIPRNPSAYVGLNQIASTTPTGALQNGLSFYDTSTNKFRCYQAGAWTDCIGSGSITGTGTSTQVSFWNSSTGLTSDPKLYWDNTNKGLSIGGGPASIVNGLYVAGNVGIGTTTPGRTLTVVGDIRATGVLYDSSNSAGTSGNFLMTTATGYQWTATSTLGLGGGTPGGTPGQIQYNNAGAFGGIATGTPGQVLAASSTSATSYEWKTIAGSGTVTSVDMTVPTGLTVSGNPITTSGTLALSLQTGYNISTSTLINNLNVFYTTPSNRITAGNNLSWSGNTINSTMASSTIIGGGTATHSPSITFASSTDTNILLNIFCSTATCTFNPGFTGTLAASRLNSNVVQGVSNDTNVTGSISAQNLTLGWTGLLAVSRGGTGTSALASLLVGSNLSVSGGQNVLIGTSTTISLGSNVVTTVSTSTSGTVFTGSISANNLALVFPVSPTFTTLTVTGSTTISSLGTGLVRSSSGGLYTDTATYLTSAVTSVSALTGTAIHVATTSDTNITISVSTTTANTLTYIPGWTGTLADARITSAVTWNAKLSTIGSGAFGKVTRWNGVNTLTDGVLLDNGTVAGVNATSSATSFLVQGSGSLNPFVIASSTGTSLLTVTPGGNVGIGTTTPAQLLSVAGNMRITGALFDSSNASGTLGMVLQTTGTTTQWVATSTLGITGGSGVSGGAPGMVARFSSATALTTGLLIDNGTVAGVNATSSTVNFLIQGTGSNNAFQVNSSTGTSLLTITPSGNVGIGTTNPSRTLTVVGTGYFTGNVGIGTSDTTGGTLNINGTGATPSIYNPTTGNGLIFRGDTGGGQLRIVSNNSAWADAQITTYFQVHNNTNDNVTFMGGTYGADTQMSRLQFNSVYTQITDLIYGSTPVPSALLELVNSSTTKVTLKVKAAANQTADIFQVNSSTGTSLLTVTAGGNVGIGTTAPTSTLFVQGTGAVNPFVVASSTGTNLLTILPSGRVGIGTITPTATLFVQGTSTTNPFVVASSTGVSVLQVTADSEVLISSTAKFRLPASASQTLTVAGQFYWDTTIGQFQYYDGNASVQRSIPAYWPTRFTAASTTISNFNFKSYGSASSTFAIPTFSIASTLSRVVCQTTLGTVNIVIGNGTASSTFVADTDGATTTPSIAFIADQNMFLVASSSLAGAEGLRCNFDSYPTNQ